MNLETGEALVSFLDAKGAPNIVQRAKILFPLSQIGAITEGQRLDIIKQSRIYGKYDTPVDRESAFEKLLKEAEESNVPAVAEQEEENLPAETKNEKGSVLKSKGKGFLSKVVKAVLTAATATIATSVGTAVSDKVTGKKTKSSKSTTEKMVKNTTSAATRTITRELTRDILGNLLK